MKIDIRDDNFSSNRKFSFSRINKDGEMIPSEADTIRKNELDEMINSNSQGLDISENDINKLNIIIDDSDCSDTFFDEVCSTLSEDGIKYKISKNGENVNVGNAVVITLDQQYSSGYESIVFAPYDNARIGDSDALTLSMYAAFKQKDVSINNILCGKVGYRVDENGNVSNMIPTDTEKNIEENHDTSFVTISFGTQQIEPSVVAKSIESGLIRYISYMNNYDSQTDLIYRSSEGEDIKMIAEYFGSTPELLALANKLESREQIAAQAIINPSVKDIDVFKSDVDYSLELTNSRTI